MMIPEPGLFRIPEEWGWPRKAIAIWVGGCTAMGGEEWPDPQNSAHAHVEPGAAKGWICVLEPTYVYQHDDSGLPNPVVIHELGHILTGQSHSQTWALTVRKWGGVVLPEEIEPTRCARYQTFVRR